MFGRLLQDSLRSGWCGKFEELSVAEDADIEEEELDFAGPSVSGELWHWRDFSTPDLVSPVARTPKGLPLALIR